MMATRSITLEELSPAFFEQVCRWLSDPSINRWLGGDWRGKSVTPTTMGIAVRNKRNRFFLIRNQNQVCGLGAFSDIDPVDQIAMVWYLIGEPTCLNKGIATHALSALVNRGFDDLGFQSIYAWVAQENIASSRVLEKAGFQEAGRLRKTACVDGRRMDRIYYDLIPNEFVEQG